MDGESTHTLSVKLLIKKNHNKKALDCFIGRDFIIISFIALCQFF